MKTTINCFDGDGFCTTFSVSTTKPDFSVVRRVIAEQLSTSMSFDVPETTFTIKVTVDED